MATQVDIINSDRVAKRVVKALKLDEVPAFRKQWQEEADGLGTLDGWLATILAKKLDVRPSRESSVISVAFTWPDAKASAAFANAFAQAYIDTSLELRIEPAKEYATFFTGRTQAARDGLELAQKKLSDFQRENGITAADERLDVENARLNELSSQLVGIQALRMDSQSRQRQAGNKDAMTEVLQNPLISGLKADLARVEARREDVVVRLGKNHPEYQRTESEITSLRERVAQETSRVLSSLTSNNQINLQREGDVRASLEAQKKKLLELKNLRDQLTVLQNDVLAAQRTYDGVTQRLNQTSLESQTQQTNVVFLNAAEAPVEHSTPKIFLNIFLAIFLGGLLGVGTALAFELVDQRVRGAQDLVRVLEVPVIGSLPSIHKPSRAKRWGKKSELTFKAA